MKLFTLLLAACCISTIAFAQWSTGTNIYNISSGYVGIGTGSGVAPTAPLHVYGSVNGDLNLLIQNTYTPGNRTFLSSFPGKSSIQTERDFSIMTYTGAWTDKFTVTNAGNVGIGTTTPTYPLQINGSASEVNLLVRNTNANGAYTYLTSLVGKGSIQSDQLFTIRTYNPAGYWADNLIVTKTGDVGIGTSITGITTGNTTTRYKLAVNGKIGAKEVQVENTSSTWADYVFEPDYKLLPLDLVEDFVKTNKHLPEIPSAEEVKINGHKLGEMDVLLLKKVEELTLYLIEQKAMIEQLQSELDAMKKSR